MLHRQRLGHYRMKSAAAAELDQRREKVGKEDEEFSHATTLPTRL